MIVTVSVTGGWGVGLLLQPMKKMNRNMQQPPVTNRIVLDFMIFMVIGF
jgi:hypothetical protein